MSSTSFFVLVSLGSSAYLLLSGGATGGRGGGDVTRGIDGIAGVTVARVGATLVTGPGTGAPAETPRFPSSIEPKGIPVRELPPGAVGDVGVDEDVRLPEPEPHVPDIPAVSIAPDVDIVALCVIPEVVDIPEVADTSDDVAPVAGVVFASESPPPS